MEDHPGAGLPGPLLPPVLTSSRWLLNVSVVSLNCGQDIKHVFILVVDILLDFPASPQVIAVAGYIVASADPTCTEEEITSLVESESSLGEATEFLVEAFEEANDNLEAATGSTLSASELEEFTDGPVVSTTTMASRFRMRGFQKQLFRQ